MHPRTWGISVRSAVVSASIVFVAVALASACLVGILYHSLLASVDDAATGRVRDIVAALQFDGPQDLDAALLATDQRVLAVQLIAQDGTVVQRSASAPSVPLYPIADIGTTLRTAIPDDASPDHNMRFSGQTVVSPAGRYTILVGAGSEAVETTAVTVALLLSVAAPIVVAVAAIAGYLVVRRSLRCVDAIRSRVAAISTSDLTERVPIPESRDEISALALTMNEMLARIESGHAAQRRFVGDASHELRNPLAAIRSALEVVEAHPELLDWLTSETLLPEVHRMQALVDDLLLLARADQSGLVLRHDEVFLDSIAQSDAARLQRETALAVDAKLSPARLVGDVGAMTRVMRNLQDNAVRHAKSRIEITVESKGGNVVVTIGDDGPGIPEADRQRVFNRFVRLDYDRSRSGGGSGLGLAIVAEIVAAHDGIVAIGDRPGGGTLVTVCVPSGS